MNIHITTKSLNLEINLTQITNDATDWLDLISNKGKWNQIKMPRLQDSFKQLHDKKKTSQHGVYIWPNYNKILED